MSNEGDSASGKNNTERETGRTVDSSRWTGEGGAEPERGKEQAEKAAERLTKRLRQTISELKMTDWLMVVLTGAIAFATAWNTVYVGGQLAEMRAASTDTHNLVTATQTLAQRAKDQADAMDKLRGAGQAQADAMDKLRKAGETQADAMNKLRIAGETQATATQHLADAGRSQAESTRNLAENSARQLGAIQASADAAKSQADAVQKQATATIAASQATDRLATAGQSQASAVLQSLDVAKAANDIANRASQSADRPWISITLPVDTNGPTAGQDYKVEVGISDVGRGPAINATSAIDMHIIGFNDTFNGFIDKCVGSCQTFMVFPTPNAFGGSSMALHPKLDAATVTADEVKRIADRKDAVLLRVRVDYRDSSGNDHTTSRCDYFVPKLGFSPCSAGNMAN